MPTETLRERLEGGARQFATRGNPVASKLLQEAVAALDAARDLSMCAAVVFGGGPFTADYLEDLREKIEKVQALGPSSGMRVADDWLDRVIEEARARDEAPVEPVPGFGFLDLRSPFAGPRGSFLEAIESEEAPDAD